MVGVGLWHGLVFLPLLLIVFGPSAPSIEREIDEEEAEENSWSGKVAGGADKGERVNKVARRTSSSKTVTRKKKSCICGCVNAEKEEVSTIRTYSLRARAVTASMRRRRARQDKRRRSRRPPQQTTREARHKFLVTPPEYLREWIVESSHPSKVGDAAADGKRPVEFDLPRIPRARVKLDDEIDGQEVQSLTREAAKADVSTQDVTVQRLNKKDDGHLFRPIVTAPPTSSSPIDKDPLVDELHHPQPLTPAQNRTPMRFFAPLPSNASSIPFHPLSSPLPACPPTPPELRTKSNKAAEEKDSLFNSSYHPVMDSDDCNDKYG